MPAEHIDCLVIGGGQAGLGVSRELGARGVEHLVVEQGRIGDSWRSQRWDSFALNTPAWMNRLPGDAPAVDPHGFASASQFVLGLERYAFAQRLPVREGVTVRAVDAGPAGEAVTVATDDGVYEARATVLASGGSRVPRVPPIGAELPGSILQLHTAGYRRAADLPGGAVLVVGGGQSGVQIAEDLLTAGRRVLLATSAVPRVPRRYRGRDMLGWLVDDGYFDERRDQTTPRPNPQISGSAGGRTLSYQHLERLGAALLGGVEGISGSRVLLRDDLARNIAYADESSAALRARVDAHIARSGVPAPEPDLDPADEPYPLASLTQPPNEVDLRRAGVSTVIWATGFGAATSFVRAPVVGRRGQIAHRAGATAVPGLFVVGQSWLRTRRSSSIYGVVADAPHVAGLVSVHLAGRRSAAA